LKRIPLPAQVYLKECLEYNPKAGEIRWKARPVSHFKNEVCHRRWNTSYSKKIAGSLAKTVKEYRTVSVAGQKYFVHQIIWVLVYGESPDEIDHIDGNGLNNQLLNLRSVSRVENCRNQRLRTTNTSGVVGVGWKKSRKKWRAYIMIEGKQTQLGSFSKKEDAVECRKKAEEKHGFHPNHGSIRPL